MAMTAMNTISTFEDATPLLQDPERFRRKAAEDGFFYFKGLVDPGAVLALRKRILERASAGYGFLATGHDLMEGVAREKREGLEEKPGSEWMPLYKEILKMREFNQLALDPAINEMFEKLFGEEPLAHPRNICRFMMPGNNRQTTPPHQDYLYIRGTENTWTVWIPLGDCPEELGGLAVIPGSHLRGHRKTFRAEGAGGNGVGVDSEEAWVAGPMAAGDILVFHSLTVHQGRDNLTDRVRLSADFRYQPASETVHQRSLEPHLGLMSWDELYSDWDEQDSLKYYWKSRVKGTIES